MDYLTIFAANDTIKRHSLKYWCSAYFTASRCGYSWLHPNLWTLCSSLASTYSCSTSVAGDDHSFSSSSSSQSDASYGSRFPFWVEQSVRSHLSNEMASSSSTLKALTLSDDRLYGAAREASGSHQSSVLHQPGGLNDCDRQSSLDSGIGIATGSQSSHSGSFSSCNGSLDMASRGGGGGEDNESVASSPAYFNPPSSPPPSPTPPSSPFQPMITLEQTCPSRCGSQGSRRHSQEYQIPSLLRRWYDTPRSLLQALTLREPSAQKAPPDLGSRTSTDGGGTQEQMLMRGPRKPRAQCQWMMQRSHSWGSETAPSMDSEGRSTPRAQVASGNLVPGETQVLENSNKLISSFWDFKVFFFPIAINWQNKSSCLAIKKQKPYVSRFDKL